MTVRRAEHLAEVSQNDVSYVLVLGHLSEQPQPIQLRGTAAAIWSLVDGTLTEQQIVDVLVDESGAARERVTAEVRAFLSELALRGLIDA